VFLGYTVLGLLAGLFVQVYVTETKGRSLEDIEADLRRKADTDVAAGTGRRRAVISG
jgi:hypothetical protein